MDLNHAYLIAGDICPAPQEDVDIFCPDCDGSWNSRLKAIPTIGAQEITHRLYIGNENCDLAWDVERERSVEYYYCPNGCKDATFGRRAELIRYDAYHRNTPFDDWTEANLLVRKDKLEREIEDIDNELKCYGD